MRLFPLLLCFSLGFSAALTASAQDTRPESAAAAGPKPLTAALTAARGKDWSNAERLAARAGGSVATDLVLWHQLRAGDGSATEVSAFLKRRADWPGLKLLRKRSEEVMVNASRDAILTFYAEQPPQSGTGLRSYVRALEESGQRNAAQQALIAGWTTLALDTADHAALIKRHGDTLRPHHTARLDMVLWKGWQQNSRDMLPLVSASGQALAKARLGLRASVDGVDTLIAAVPRSLSEDAGLAYERFQWRLRKGRREDAIALMMQRSPKDLGQAEEWGRARRDLSRRLMRAGEARQAYSLASNHGLSEGRNYADLEWLSGFLALRFLKDADRAVTHFERFRAAVFTPISLGRAGYWLGRAHDARGDKHAALTAYAFGADYQTSFYGLLAAEKAGLTLDPALGNPRRYPGWRQADFARDSNFEAALLLINAGDLTLAERFLRHMAETLPEAELNQLGTLLTDLNQPHLGVMVGKQAAQRGLTIAAPYYALHPLRDMKLAARPELSLAIARRESEFDPKVVSHAGAEGLMQVMPATARLVARRLGVDHDPAAMLNNWQYNALLGSAYLAQLGDQFDGNILLVSAGYNAGPKRPERWMQVNGDPRRSYVDVIDWIELIPFNETRNYVMRVAESLPVYRARLGQEALPQPFSAELKGSSVRPLPR
jgi:soluble lytic murein transglycosylase